MAKHSNVISKGAEQKCLFFLKVLLDYLDALVPRIVPHKHSLCPTSGELGSGHPTSGFFLCCYCLSEFLVGRNVCCSCCTFSSQALRKVESHHVSSWQWFWLNSGIGIREYICAFTCTAFFNYAFFSMYLICCVIQQKSIQFKLSINTNNLITHMKTFQWSATI